MPEDEFKRLCSLVLEIVQRALSRPDRSLQGRVPVPGAPESGYYRLYWLAIKDPDNMPEAVEMECPFDHHLEWVPQFVADGMRQVDKLLCMRTDDAYTYESDGYLAFGSAVDAENALERLKGRTKDLIHPCSEYGYIELEIWLCEPASFAAPLGIGMGQRITGIQFARDTELIN
jgi:hypothetical protein